LGLGSFLQFFRMGIGYGFAEVLEFEQVGESAGVSAFQPGLVTSEKGQHRGFRESAVGVAEMAKSVTSEVH
jgi:hypothetical protein